MELKETQVRDIVDLSLQQPFSAKIRLQGTQDILFHRWNDEDVQAKAEAKKGS